MTRNILLISLDTLEKDKPLRYYSARNEYNNSYCEAVQSVEASTKYILAHYPIDEIICLGEEDISDNEDIMNAHRLWDADALSSAASEALSAYDLYRSRLSQYIGEMSLEQQSYDTLLPEDERLKLIDFIQSFQAQYSERQTKRLSRFFDELACSRELYDRFKDALFAAIPEARKDSRITMKWVKNYLYTQLKASAKLEILPVNESISARYVPANRLENREYWIKNIFAVDQADFGGEDEVNLFVSMSSESAVDAHLILNILNILVSAPESIFHLKKIYRVYEAAGNLTGRIADTTAISLSTDLVAAAHAFLNYSKTDMLMNFWKNSGVHDERISSLIYAARHVDVGMSMCNISEVQEGIQRLLKIIEDKRSWTEDDDYGLMFGVILGCIQADYSSLLEEDGTITFIGLIKWAYRHQLYQQVLTLIESYAPSNLVQTGVFYYCDDEARVPEITKLLALQRLELKPYEYYKMDDLDHYFIKNYDRGGVRLSGSKDEDRNLTYAALRARSIGQQNPSKINGHTVCRSIDTVQNVLYAYYHLGVVRNKISHADAGAMAERRLIVSESDDSYAMLLMKESIEFFIKSYEAAMEEVRGKNPKIVMIAPDDVRSAADRIKREKRQEER